MQKLTIQALLDQNWLDIAELKLLEPKLGSASASELVYELEYAIQNLDKRDEHACSLSLPVQILINHESSSWFGFWMILFLQAQHAVIGSIFRLTTTHLC